MKKLLVALTMVTLALPAFAEKTTVVTFDSSKMKCGKHHIEDGINKKQVKGMRCTDYQDKKTDIVFNDDNSHKLVDCKVDNVGNITLAKCTAIN